MRRALHLLLLCAVAPGIFFPATWDLCFCAAIDCRDCGACCEVAPPPAASCCGEAVQGCCGEERAPADGPAMKSRNACRGCVVLTTAKQETPRPRAHGDDVVASVAGEAVDLPGWLGEARCGVPAPRPIGQAPPDRWRTLPLVI
jgi:hypothetical protein